jgi:hypothetical protein
LTYLAGSIALTFAALSAIHVYWAMGGRRGAVDAIPEVDGKPLFKPGALATLTVAGLLALAAALILERAGLLPDVGPKVLSRDGTCLVAAAMIARAIGDFNHVGFFKRRRGTRFARLDTRLYSPLTLALGLGSVVIAAYH